MVLVIEGANDLLPQLETWRVLLLRGLRATRPAVDLMGQRLQAALAEIRRLAPAHAQVVVAGYWNVFPDGDTARADGGQPLIDWSRSITRAANAAIDQAARPERATYVDLTPPLPRRRGQATRPTCSPRTATTRTGGVRAIVATLLGASRPPPSAG